MADSRRWIILRTMSEPLLQIVHLGVAFEKSRAQVHAVRDVSLSVLPGQTVAVVGESGSAAMLTRLHRAKTGVTSEWRNWQTR